MPLAINNGTLLNPQPPVVPAGQQLIVDIPHRPQEGRLWCWAACVQMVLELHHVEKSQCEIVKLMLDKPNHQCGPDFQSRDESCDFVDMAPTWRACGINGVDPDNGALDIDVIKAEIAANRPIQAGIIWKAGGAHAVLIKGWSPTSPETLLIEDPLRDSPVEPILDKSGRATLKELLTAFAHGSWALSWKNLQ